MTTYRHKSMWYDSRHPHPSKALQLFCLPYAGGSSQIFANWQDYFPADIAVWCVEFPGRRRRIREPLVRSVRSMTDGLAAALSTEIEQPFILFGHSMGALISFELARELRRRHGAEPLHLFVSGRRAPHLPAREPRSFDLPDDQLLQKLRELKGTPEALLQNEETMQCLLPLLRADFELVQTYAFEEDNPLSCPITVYGGIEDSTTPIEDLRPWGLHTSAKTTVRMFPGGHFFLQDPGAGLIKCLRTDVLKAADQMREAARAVAFIS